MVKVYDDIHPYNQISWVQEKVRNSLVELIYYSMQYDNNNSSENNLVDLQNIFCDLFKLYVFFNGLSHLYNHDNYIEMREFVYKYKIKGLQHFDYITGLSTKKILLQLNIWQ